MSDHKKMLTILIVSVVFGLCVLGFIYVTDWLCVYRAFHMQLAVERFAQYPIRYYKKHGTLPDKKQVVDEIKQGRIDLQGNSSDYEYIRFNTTHFRVIKWAPLGGPPDDYLLVNGIALTDVRGCVYAEYDMEKDGYIIRTTEDTKIVKKRW